MTTAPIDLDPPLRLLKKVKGLRVNYLDNKLCCYIPQMMEQLVGSLKSNTMVNICAGCHANVTKKLKLKPGYRAIMLPELLFESVKK